jgi:hypothetical protein
MTCRLSFLDGYLKSAQRFLKNHPEISGQYQKPFAPPSLRLHRLQGRGAACLAFVGLSQAAERSSDNQHDRTPPHIIHDTAPRAAACLRAETLYASKN